MCIIWFLNEYLSQIFSCSLWRSIRWRYVRDAFLPHTKNKPKRVGEIFFKNFFSTPINHINWTFVLSHLLIVRATESGRSCMFSAGKVVAIKHPKARGACQRGNLFKKFRHTSKKNLNHIFICHHIIAMSIIIFITISTREYGEGRLLWNFWP